MAYIAIKNTEHKGVYKKSEMNTEIMTTKGISHRKFPDNQLQEALKWAGVKDIKTGTPKPKKKNKSNTTANNNTNKTNEVSNKVDEVSFAFKAIEDIKKQGHSAVCITLKNRVEIIAKIDDSYILKRNDSINFDSNKTTVENMKIHIEKGIEHIEKCGENYSYYSTPPVLKYDVDLITIKNNTTYKNISKDCIYLDNFCTRRVSDDCDAIFEKKQMLLSRIIELEYRRNDVWKSHNDLYLNVNEILSIKPLEITLPSNSLTIGQKSNTGYVRNLSKKEALEIEKIYKDTLSKYNNFKDILRTEINK